MVEVKQDEGLFMALTDKQQQEIYDKIVSGKWPSRGIFADDSNGVDDTVGMLLNSDGNIWDVFVILGALSGVTEHINRVKRLAGGGGPNGKNERFVTIAKELLRFMEASQNA